MPTKTKKRPLKTRTPRAVKKRKPARAAPVRRRHARATSIRSSSASGCSRSASSSAPSSTSAWDGGIVGRAVPRDRGSRRRGVYGVPPALVALGGLMLFRSSTVDVRPFRRGLTVLGIGLLLVLGAAHGGELGSSATRCRPPRSGGPAS